MATKGVAFARSIGEGPPNLSRQERPDLPTHPLLTVQEAAALLHVPVSWVYEHTRRGAPDALPVVKVGKYVRFRPSDLLDYIDRKSRVRTSR
jgi:excisionase family DNA binding protein